ncbi:MAG: ABC transporter permease [Candidatus Bathyarchaeota archaeon]|nr:ABC transporter permease [Candidatus Bathyarchaeota archaeon]
MFTIPVTLFKPPDTPIGYVSANIFLSVTVFLSYSLATWDWASELRSIAVAGVLEYMLVSSRSILTIYIGLIPVSTVWLLLSLITVYAIFSFLSLPPILSIHSPLFLAIGILSFLQVLVAHAIMLGGTILSADVSGPIMEMLGWLLPIVTGGFTPLSSMPPQLRIVALSTPYSYPVELLRYSILGLETALPLNLMVPISLAYSLVFLLSSLLYFKRVILKMMVEGIRSIGMH